MKFRYFFAYLRNGKVKVVVLVRVFAQQLQKCQGLAGVTKSAPPVTRNSLAMDHPGLPTGPSLLQEKSPQERSGSVASQRFLRLLTSNVINAKFA